MIYKNLSSLLIDLSSLKLCLSLSIFLVVLLSSTNLRSKRNKNESKIAKFQALNFLSSGNFEQFKHQSEKYFTTKLKCRRRKVQHNSRENNLQR